MRASTVGFIVRMYFSELAPGELFRQQFEDVNDKEIVQPLPPPSEEHALSLS